MLVNDVSFHNAGFRLTLYVTALISFEAKRMFQLKRNNLDLVSKCTRGFVVCSECIRLKDGSLCLYA